MQLRCFTDSPLLPPPTMYRANKNTSFYCQTLNWCHFPLVNQTADVTIADVRHLWSTIDSYGITCVQRSWMILPEIDLMLLTSSLPCRVIAAVHAYTVWWRYNRWSAVESSSSLKDHIDIENSHPTAAKHLFNQRLEILLLKSQQLLFRRILFLCVCAYNWQVWRHCRLV